MIRNDSPRQAVMPVDGLNGEDARGLAVRSVDMCRQYMPRVTGVSARSIEPIWGPGWFGVEWTHDSIYMQETGSKPFTMNALAGKTIPMWVRDEDGSVRRDNPKVKTRVREDDGTTQVLIFRRAANHGQRKEVWREEGGRLIRKDVPASYPGAPGRIAVNRNQGDIRGSDGRIKKGNVGVRWRHPGLDAGYHLVRGLSEAAKEFGFPVNEVVYATQGQYTVGSTFDIVSVRG